MKQQNAEGYEKSGAKMTQYKGMQTHSQVNNAQSPDSSQNLNKKEECSMLFNHITHKSRA